MSSKYLTIKAVARPSPVLEEVSPELSRIYEIEDTRIVVERHGSHRHHLLSLRIPDRAVIEHIKKTRDILARESQQSIIQIPGDIM